MKRIKIIIAVILISLLANLLFGCGFSSSKIEVVPFMRIDNTKWNYNSTNDIWWQAGLTYCEKPVDTDYQTLGIYIPGKYMSGEKNDSGYYTCKLTDEKIGEYKADTAPIVIPVNTPGYSAMKSPTGFEKRAAEYTEVGFIYISTGCRGRDSGAPAGVTDLKAAIRYIKWNTDQIAGDTDKIFSFGHSGGGAQSALLGATGDSKMYEPYLESIGAVMTESDAVFGAMCWCPITALDVSDSAYEWNMGLTRSEITDEEKEISERLTEGFAEYINAIDFKDENGKVLKLEKTDDNAYQSGTYYDYVCSEIARSIEVYIATNGDEAEKILKTIDPNSTFTKVENGKVIVTNLSEFAKKYKVANKTVCAFDGLNREQTENIVFGLGNNTSLHFSRMIRDVLLGTEYESDFAADFKKADFCGNTVEYRENMYNPMYFITEYYDGYNTSVVAENWRIRSGIEQGDTALTTEINLALALKSMDKNVDFLCVWNKGHTEAEVEGSSTENFINWVNDCCK